jgi:hypothetical protein
MRTTLVVAAAVAVALAARPAGAQEGAGNRGPAVRAGCPADDMKVFYPCALARAKSYTPPRTPDGKPDLQGVWNRWTMNYAIGAWQGNQFSRSQKSLIVDVPDGEIPYQPWARAQVQTNFDKHLDPNAVCLPPGSPRWYVITPGTQIMQKKDQVVMYHTEAHTYRVIPTDGRPHVDERVRLFAGDSRGRWEGNTLVIDVRNQDARGVWFTVMGDFATDAIRSVERLTRISADTILVEVDVEDPNVFTRPWKMVTYLTREDDEELLEESCHEGDKFSKEQLRSGTRSLYPGFVGRIRTR